LRRRTAANWLTGKQPLVDHLTRLRAVGPKHQRAPHRLNEYLRPLMIVLALSLLGSWLACLTVTPLLCHHFLR
jgi:hypothetical protein